MAVNIYVGLENGRITCLHDPAYMRIHDHGNEKHTPPDKHLVWHNDNGVEITLTFTESPFQNGKLEVSGHKQIRERVKDHASSVEYKYDVKVTDSDGHQHKVDPGLIIDP
jgi:hypothetical protein